MATSCVVWSSMESFGDFSGRWKLCKFRKQGIDKKEKRQNTAEQIKRYLSKDMVLVLASLPMVRVGKADVLKVFRLLRLEGRYRFPGSITIGCFSIRWLRN